MDKYTLPVCNTAFSGKTEIPVTYDITLPDYCAGIGRIIKTDANAYAESAYFSDGHLTAKGRIIIRITYISDQNGNIKSVIFPFDINHSFDVSDVNFSDDEPITEARMFTVSVSGKQRSQRSAEIKANIAVCASIYECYEKMLFNAGANPDVQIKSVSDYAVYRKMISHTPEDIKTDIVLDSGLPAIEELSDYGLYMMLDRKEYNGGKINYSGTVKLKCTYLAEKSSPDEPAHYIRLTKELPFSGEVELETLLGDVFVLGRIVPLETEIGSSADPYGENRIVNAVIGYELVFDVLGKTETEYAVDGFCPGYECDFIYEEQNVDCGFISITEKHRVTERLPADRTSLVQTEDCDFYVNITGTEVLDGKLCVTGKGYFTVIGTDERGEPDSVSGAVSVKIPIDTLNGGADRKYIFNADVISCNTSMRDGEIILDADLEISGVEIRRKTVRMITGADIVYEEPKALCRNEYIIYYPEKDEVLWDIARKYEIPVEDIASANNFKGADIGTLHAIIIPCKG